jgi:NDP-hexose-3-ketoreductase
MKRLRVGVLGCSSFAIRAMLPALQSCAGAELVCVASRSADVARSTAVRFGCAGLVGYQAALERDDVDAVYIPLPTGLHEEWCTRAFEAGKHVLVEKSFALNVAGAKRMLALARARNCLVVENFQFETHSQWATLLRFAQGEELGSLHLVRGTFGFPPLPRDNFRWSAALGGGALLDAGAYMVKASQLLLGRDLRLVGALLHADHDSRVDKYGEAMFRNDAGQVAQVAFGFDYFYQCRLELLGSKAKVTASRIFTAPPGYQPTLTIEKQDNRTEITLPADNHYQNMWNWFVREVQGRSFESHWLTIGRQAQLIEDIRVAAGANALG